MYIRRTVVSNMLTDGKCSVFLSSDLSLMCDTDKKCSVQHKFIHFG